ncbi:MAG: cation-transporting P-type ATPase [Rhodospirillaceae bacterium]|nr:cation-transporting P-type ATPase [Rhodospirillaceae bacterium]
MFRVLPAARLDVLRAASQGLTSTEAAEHLARYGTNTIIETPSLSWMELALQTGRDPMIWFLLGTALLFTWIGEYVEAAVLAVAILPIMGMDAYLHRRTQASTEGLAVRIATTALVVRDDKIVETDAQSLVPGDLVIVQGGSSFPADGLIVEGHELQVDESALTGEAMPVRKSAFSGSAPNTGDMIIDNAHWGLAGTRLLMNDAKLRIVFTGSETLYGQIVHTAQSGMHERTPLQYAINSLVTLLIVIATIVCIGLAVTRYYQGHGLVDAIVSAVTLAVAALPEEFPVVFTFFLGVGVYRLARKQALVRRAIVVENIGRVTCICSDKTGTLTQGQLHLAHFIPAEGVNRERLLKIAARASRSLSADPLDLAILKEVQGTHDDVAVVATFPFTEDRRREVSVLRSSVGELTCAVKGAPETIFALTTLDPEARRLWHARTQEFASSGFKVIACAERAIENRTWIGGEPEQNFDFLGLLAFGDPVRPGAREAVAEARNAGIRVIMVTGDHPSTAKTVAQEIGIGARIPRVIEGEDLPEIISRNDLGAVDVIARAIPAMKLDLVRALQQQGEIVAVTGDGVNDVPALQGADIGIAMGGRGTRTAREVASIVLLDDNFQTIVRAIAEGRQLFKNLRLSFTYLLMVHIPLAITAAFVPFLGLPLLYLPAHIVWLELIIHPTALLVFQQLPLASRLERLDRTEKLRIFNLKEWALIGMTGAAITLAIILGYTRSSGDAQDVEHARTMSLVTLIISSSTLAACLSGLSTKAATFMVAVAFGSAILFAQIPLIAGLLHLAPLHSDDWLIAISGGALTASLVALFPYCRTPKTSPN